MRRWWWWWWALTIYFCKLDSWSLLSIALSFSMYFLWLFVYFTIKLVYSVHCTILFQSLNTCVASWNFFKNNPLYNLSQQMHRQWYMKSWSVCIMYSCMFVVCIKTLFKCLFHFSKEIQIQIYIQCLCAFIMETVIKEVKRLKWKRAR